MAKRFTETTKWTDKWYRTLTIKHKAFWQFLCDRCDNAGVWNIDFELASFYIGDTINEKDIEALNNGKERVVVVSDKYLVIREFIAFQIGDTKQEKLTNLQKNCNSLVKSYLQKGIDIVKMTNLTGKLRVTTSSYQIRCKGKDKGKDKDKGIGKDEDKVFIESLKKNKAYEHINIDIELDKMDAWLLAHKGRQKTKRFVVNWLNKIEKPLPIVKKIYPQQEYKAPKEGRHAFTPPPGEAGKIIKDLSEKNKC